MECYTSERADSHQWNPEKSGSASTRFAILFTCSRYGSEKAANRNTLSRRLATPYGTVAGAGPGRGELPVRDKAKENARGGLVSLLLREDHLSVIKHLLRVTAWVG